MKNVLITGMNGFVGSAIAQRLFSLDKDIHVVGIVKDRNYKSRRDILDRCSVVYADIRDYDAVRFTMSHYEIDTVFHVAAVTILRKSVMDPVSCYQVNMMGTVNILEASRQVGVKKVVVIKRTALIRNFLTWKLWRFKHLQTLIVLLKPVQTCFASLTPKVMSWMFLL
jgi:CDP-glucose 4,6-dehydratase